VGKIPNTDEKGLGGRGGTRTWEERTGAGDLYLPNTVQKRIGRKAFRPAKRRSSSLKKKSEELRGKIKEGQRNNKKREPEAVTPANDKEEKVEGDH